jgi:hypothetical protein
MLTKGLNKLELAPEVSVRPARAGRVAGSLKYDWLMAVLIFWLIGGVHIDGWAHQHVPGLETFFTPWHAIFYSGFVAIGSFLAATLVGNRLRGYAWTKALPLGYGLSLVGVLIFAFGGVADMVWHTVFGIEVSVEALLSPSHLLLATGGVLIASGPLRAAWWRGGRAANLSRLLPMLISATMLLSIFTFFTVYGSLFATSWPSANRQVYTRQLQEFNVSIGLIGLLFQSALLMGLTLLLLRRWQLPFGSLTLLYTANIALLTFMRDRQLSTPIFAFILVGLATGLAADLFITRFRPSASRPLAFRVFAALTPALLYGLYFLVLALTGAIWWTTAVWTGAIFLAGVAGLLMSYVALPPRMPAGVEAG